MSTQSLNNVLKLDDRSIIRSALLESIEVKKNLSESDVSTIDTIAECCAMAIANGHKILLCGNGRGTMSYYGCSFRFFCYYSSALHYIWPSGPVDPKTSFHRLQQIIDPHDHILNTDGHHDKAHDAG